MRDADVAEKHVLVRSDLNVPLEDGSVADETRIHASLPTLHLLLGNGAQEVRVCSHLGRPKTDEDRDKYSMEPVRERLRELLPDERLVVLENTRFNPGETKNDPEFARELAAGCDLFVNDAFGSAHRAHASTVGVAELLPAYAGLLLEQELERRQRGADTHVVRHLPVLERDVQVGADEDGLARDVGVANGPRLPQPASCGMVWKSSTRLPPGSRR